MLVGLVDDLAARVAERRRSSRRRRPSGSSPRARRPARSRSRPRSRRTSPCARTSGCRPRRPRRRGSPRRQPVHRFPNRVARRPGSPGRAGAKRSRAAPFCGLRTSATTSSPRSRSLRTTCPPIKPGSTGDEDLHAGSEAYPYTRRRMAQRRPSIGRSPEPTRSAARARARGRACVTARATIRSPSSRSSCARPGVATAGELVQVSGRSRPGSLPRPRQARRGRRR